MSETAKAKFGKGARKGANAPYLGAIAARRDAMASVGAALKRLDAYALATDEPEIGVVEAADHLDAAWAELARAS